MQRNRGLARSCPESRGPNAARTIARRLTRLSAGALVLLAACAAQPSKSDAATDPGSAPGSYGALSAAGTPPAWKLEPLTWAKLEKIETWLADVGPSAPTRQNIDARLDLAEGRLKLTRAESGATAADVERKRFDAVQTDLMLVFGDLDTEPAQRARATRAFASLIDARSSRSAPAGAASTFDGLVTRAEWGARPVATSKLTRGSGDWNRITVHHSADRSGEVAASNATSGKRAVRGIQRYHADVRGWGDIGYHFLIDPAGRVYEGRELRWQGAHAGTDARGVNQNPGNIGVCLLGDYRDSKPSAGARKSLALLLEHLTSRYSISAGSVYGHTEVRSGTACPGAALQGWLADWRSQRGASARVANSSAKRGSAVASAKPKAARPKAKPKKSTVK